MIRLDDIIDRVTSYNPQADVEQIRRAYVFSAKVHQGQTRLSGEPYLTHPLGVAALLADLRMDTDSVVTGLLHDTVEDTYATQEEIEQMFGQSVAQLVEGVTKLSKVEFRSKTENQAENFRKMLLAMSEDIRVIIVKLCDRLHNMRTLEYLAPEKQRIIAQETIDIYAPLANRLGINILKSELEDLGLKYTKSESFQELKEKVATKKKEREKYIEDVVNILRRALEAHKIEGEITGRPKHFYSIYQKMERYRLTFEQVYDLIAFRIVTKTVRDCYELLGIIHSLWKPVPGRFKDYIAMPKGNGYQSLHTTVIGPGGQRVEIQIRTEEMHRVAETGVAAHWQYKESGADLETNDGSKFAWLRQLVEFHKNVEDPIEFLESVKVDLFDDEVYVFTPNGDVKSFPKGASPIDFAYKVHSEVGDHCVGAKVNGKIVPLRYELKNGDTIEILTSTTAKPSKDWLKVARTSHARQKIRYYVRKAERERSRQLGHDLLEKELKRYEISLSRMIKDDSLQAVADQFGHKTIDDFFSSVGFGKIPVSRVLARIVPEDKLQKEPPEESAFQKLVKKVTGRQTSSPVVVKGIDDMLVRFGRCCNPIPGDEITGFITRGRGVTVHSRKCPTALESDPERRIEVEWGSGKETVNAGRPVRIRVLCVDKPGILADISKSISATSVNIRTAQIRTTRDDKAYGTFEVTVRDTRQLHDVMHAVEKVKGVISVARI